MDLITLGSQLAKLGAPILGTALGGPAGGALASTIIGALADALGTAPTPEAVAKKIEAEGADAPQIIRSVEAEHGPAVLDELNARLKDVQDARSTTLKLVEQGSAIAWGAPVVSIIVMLGFALLSYLAIYAPASQREILLFLLGGWSGLAANVVGYWLGSSAGSKDKDATLARLAKGK
jgi:hypothetical protein